MTKKDIILIVGVIIIIVLAALLLNGTNANPNELITLTGSEKNLTKIDYTTYEEKINANDNFIIIIERTGCGYCEKYMPIVEESAEELGIPVYYMDTSDLSSEEFSKLSESNSYLRNNQWGTPTTLLMSGEEVIDSIGGYVEKDTFVKFIEKNINLSKEEDTTIETSDSE